MNRAATTPGKKTFGQRKRANAIQFPANPLPIERWRDLFFCASIGTPLPPALVSEVAKAIHGFLLVAKPAAKRLLVRPPPPKKRGRKRNPKEHRARNAGIRSAVAHLMATEKLNEPKAISRLQELWDKEFRDGPRLPEDRQIARILKGGGKRASPT
jgi:hypothetical protein